MKKAAEDDDSKKPKKLKQEHVGITPPNFEKAIFPIEGRIYVQHRFSQKSMLKMQATQALGDQAKKRRSKEPRDPQQDYLDSMYISTEGWNGIPASCFRNACISACKIVGFAMTRAKLSIFVIEDGYDKIDGTPLVRIYGKPHMHAAAVQPDNSGADIRYRAMWDEWTAKPLMRWDAGQFSATDVANLMTRVGQQVGIGEGRADSKNSAGMGWGHFEVKI